MNRKESQEPGKSKPAQVILAILVAVVTTITFFALTVENSTLYKANEASNSSLKGDEYSRSTPAANVNQTKVYNKDTADIDKPKGLSDELLGSYHGIQESYFLKNQHGDEVIIAGNKVPVPSIDFKFLLKQDNFASLQQTNLKDSRRHFYDGTYKIISDEPDLVKVKISLNDGKDSSPTYILDINKSDKNGKCIGRNEPVFNILKTT